MSLRIRRGTEAERVSVVLDVGELAYTTDGHRLFVGDNFTAGGRNVLATAAGSGLTWNPDTQSLDYTGEGTGIVNVQADSTPTLGGNLTLNSYNIVGTGNINITGTLGVTNGLSSNLSLGGHTINGSGTISITGSLAGGGLTLNNNTVISSTNFVSIGSSTAPIPTTRVKGQKIEFTNTTTSGGIFEQSFLSQTSRGSLSTPTTLQVDDIFGTTAMSAHNGSTYVPKVFVNGRIDTVTGTNTLPGAWTVALHDYNGSYTTMLGVNSRGTITMYTLKVTPYSTTTARNTQVGTPQAGMITFVTDDGTGNPKFQGYNGTAWVDLG